MTQEENAAFKVVVAGRRFGKTVLALWSLISVAYAKPGSICWYTAPTYRQAKQIAWSMLRGFLPPEAVASRNETDLSLTLINGSIIALRGAEENPKRGLAEFDIAKHRNGETGRFEVIFDAKTQTIRNLQRT